MKTVLLIDGSSIFTQALQSKPLMEKLSIGDHVYPMETIIEKILNFVYEYPSEVVLCFDYGSWRKDYDSNYKANRKEKKEKQKYEYKLIYDFIDRAIKEFEEFNIFKIVRVFKAEADDTISVLAKHIKDNVIIWSNDVDLAVNMKYSNVQHYRMNSFVKYPYTYKSEKVVWNTPMEQSIYEIIRGQPTKDNIPSVVNCYDGDNIRFGPVSAIGVINAIKDGNFETCSELEKFRVKYGDKWKSVFAKNFQRNKTLLDFDCIPDYIVNNTIQQYNIKIDKPNFEKLFQSYGLYSLEDKLFMYNSILGERNEFF